MKNLFKFGFLAFALTLGLVSCGEQKTADAEASVVDTTIVDTAVDTAAKIDSAKN